MATEHGRSIDSQVLATKAPNAVALPSGKRVVPASVDRRAGAFLVDTVLAFALVLAPWIALDAAGGLTGEDWYWIGFLLGFFFYVAIPALFMYAAFATMLAFLIPEWAWRGRSVGKLLFGIAVRDGQDGSVVPFQRLLRREWFRAWRMVLIVPAFLDHARGAPTPFFEVGHDRAAGTVVLRCGRY